MNRLAPLLSWLAFPIYIWQGLGVRRRTERMLPAKGPVRHRIDGTGPEIRLLALGDSSIASVGVDDARNGVAASLARLLNEKTGRPVTWRAAGFNSATSGQIRDHVLPNLDAANWTHILLVVGTNDAKNFHSVPRFKREFGGLLYGLRAKWPEARVIWSPIVEMSRMPALPDLLGKILEIRAQAINAKGEALCFERGAVPASRLPILDPQAGFSTDGFHASQLGYQAWAEHLLPVVLGDE